jgi:nucleotide-binding universal stress UspA family protein
MRRETKSGLNKITWAVDPFCDLARLPIQGVRAIHALNGTAPETEPVAVLNLWDPLLAPRHPYGSGGKISPAAERFLKKIVRRVRFPGLMPPRVLVVYGNSTRESVDALIRHAQSEGSDLIVVGTHARKGVPRLFLGSFAETLILRSPLPVLVVNPRVKVRERVQTLLFPTDFSPGSHQVFPRVVDLARQTGARILLFHRLDIPLSPIEYPFAWSEELTRDLAKKRAEQSEPWLAEARAAGVHAQFQLSRAMTPVAQAIRAAASHLPSPWIAMASRSGPFESLLAGSVTRQLARTADCPLWILHPEKARKSSRGKRGKKGKA